MQKLQKKDVCGQLLYFEINSVQLKGQIHSQAPLNLSKLSN